MSDFGRNTRQLTDQFMVDELDDILDKEMDIALEDEERRFAFAAEPAESI